MESAVSAVIYAVVAHIQRCEEYKPVAVDGLFYVRCGVEYLIQGPLCL